MKRIWIMAGLVLASGLFLSYALAQEKAPAGKATTTKATFQYIGSGKCKLCHNTVSSGKQYDKWLSTKHAKAYATLASEESKKIAKEKGIADPQKSEKCLKCHVTAFTVPAAQKAATLTLEEGVGCEACHGPGEKYKDMKIMKDRKLSMENGLILPTEKICVTCHNQESPFYKPFKFEEMVKLIAHPKPKPKG